LVPRNCPKGAAVGDYFGFNPPATLWLATCLALVSVGVEALSGHGHGQGHGHGRMAAWAWLSYLPLIGTYVGTTACAPAGLGGSVLYDVSGICFCGQVGRAQAERSGRQAQGSSSVGGGQREPG
jgi:hypothetical protein